MNDIFLQQPTRQHWIESEEDFADMGFPHAIGAIDGKHFAIKVTSSNLILIRASLETVRNWISFLQLQGLFLHRYVSSCRRECTLFVD